VNAPEDHENTAMAALHRHAPRDAPRDAVVSAVLALAAAVNRLAEARESAANSIIDFKPDQPPKTGRRGHYGQ
jgi:hypothetical protein